MVEAIYHKAVIVGVPLRCVLNAKRYSTKIEFHSNDQKPNLLRAVKHGYAVSLVWDDMTGQPAVFKKKTYLSLVCSWQISPKD